jgi:hypothetical protein
MGGKFDSLSHGPLLTILRRHGVMNTPPTMLDRRLTPKRRRELPDWKLINTETKRGMRCIAMRMPAIIHGSKSIIGSMNRVQTRRYVALRSIPFRRRGGRIPEKREVLHLIFVSVYMHRLLAARKLAMIDSLVTHGVALIHWGLRT